MKKYKFGSGLKEKWLEKVDFLKATANVKIERKKT